MEGPSLFFFGTCSEPTWQSCATSFRYILYWYYLSAPDDGKKTSKSCNFFWTKNFQAPEVFFFLGRLQVCEQLFDDGLPRRRSHTHTQTHLPQPDLPTLIISYFNLNSPDVSFRITTLIWRPPRYIPFLELTYPTLGKRKIIDSKVPFRGWDMLL